MVWETQWWCRHHHHHCGVATTITAVSCTTCTGATLATTLVTMVAIAAVAPAPLAVRIVPVVVGAGLALVGGSLTIYLAGGATFQQMFDLWVFQNAPSAIVILLLFGPAVRRQPGNRAAWLFLAGGVAATVHVTAMALSFAGSTRHPGIWDEMAAGTMANRDIPPEVIVPLWIGGSVWVLAAGVPTVLGLLYFPDGDLPSRRWRPAAALAVTGLALSTMAYVWGYRPWSPHPVPLNDPPTHELVPLALFSVGMPLVGVGALMAIASLVVRLRSAAPAERRRVRPVVVSGSLFTATMVVFYPWQGLWAVLTIPAVVLFLMVIAASVARHHLFDVELVVSRAVAVAALGAGVTVVYLAIVVGIGRFVGRDLDLGLSVVATAVVAVGFEPVRRRVRLAATRLVSGTDVRPDEVLAALSDRLARARTPQDALDGVVGLLVDATGATRAEVRWQRAGAVNVAAAAGDGPTDGAVAVRSAPVTNGGEVLGEVRLLASRDDRFLAADERVLTQLAVMLGPVLRNVRLTDELHQHIAQLQASRQRLVTAHDEARLALERDIHDGAQQQLLALRLRLGLAATIAEQDGAERALAVLEQAGVDADAAIRQLRSLARGLYPPLLAEEGLESALRARARDPPVPVTLSVDGTGRHDRAVETAVWFCCLEALQNASKHAGASSVHIELALRDDELAFTVRDDGAGFDPDTSPRGAGLTNLSDRISALGGSLRIDSAPGRGTAVRGTVPLHPEATPHQPVERQPEVAER
jgi:two-component system, NarL family, sensor kinase